VLLQQRPAHQFRCRHALPVGHRGVPFVDRLGRSTDESRSPRWPSSSTTPVFAEISAYTTSTDMTDCRAPRGEQSGRI
jgi:hypothetical protein